MRPAVPTGRVRNCRSAYHRELLAAAGSIAGLKSSTGELAAARVRAVAATVAAAVAASPQEIGRENVVSRDRIGIGGPVARASVRVQLSDQHALPASLE